MTGSDASLTSGPKFSWALHELFDVKVITKHRRRVVTDRVFGRDPLYRNANDEQGCRDPL